MLSTPDIGNISSVLNRSFPDRFANSIGVVATLFCASHNSNPAVARVDFLAKQAEYHRFYCRKCAERNTIKSSNETFCFSSKGRFSVQSGFGCKITCGTFPSPKT